MASPQVPDSLREQGQPAAGEAVGPQGGAECLYNVSCSAYVVCMCHIVYTCVLWGVLYLCESLRTKFSHSKIWQFIAYYLRVFLAALH